MLKGSGAGRAGVAMPVTSCMGCFQTNLQLAKANLSPAPCSASHAYLLFRHGFVLLVP